MVAKFMVFAETEQHFPASMKGPARDQKSLLLLDMSEPADARMQNMFQYVVREGETQYFGKSQGKTLDLALHGFFQGKNGKPYAQGKILGFSK